MCSPDCLFVDGCYVCIDDLITFLLVHIISHPFENLVGDIFHILEDGDGEPGICKLFSIAGSPEAISQVVMLQGGVVLNVPITTVVVGDYQTFVRDKLACATSPEEHHGILH
ncbi:MAG: hypothetical protein BWY89_01967 [Bacteroidetes bacterium ADurb.BinA012]|nr:MAG: hypothetical protein BWY89_01967 [Bacteroidetes bacterium ADurb.BinA012]